MVLRPVETPSIPLVEIAAIEKIECGADAATHFAFEPGLRNLNHGSYGTAPIAVRSVWRYYQDLCDGNPDKFIRFLFPKFLDEQRAVLARYLNAPLDTCVIVPNATTGVNIVLRNLVYHPGDVIVYLPTTYGAIEKTITYLTESTAVQSERVPYEQPMDDEDVCAAFDATLTKVKQRGQNPKVALFDTISSMPGVRVPFARLVQICKAHGVLSCIDGAHSIGQIPIDLSALDPDFYVSNCHKWLHVPRACAAFYVPVRNQHLMRSTLPTSAGFVPKPVEGGPPVVCPGPPGVSEFVYNFSYCGTVDATPFLCIRAALAWRAKLVWRDLRGEAAAMAYCAHLARVGGDRIAAILGTEAMDNAEGTLRQCALVQVRLPLGGKRSDEELARISEWSVKVLDEEYHTFIPGSIHSGEMWVRVSGQVYLTLQDFEWAGWALRDICDKITSGEWEKNEDGGL